MKLSLRYACFDNSDFFVCIDTKSGTSRKLKVVELMRKSISSYLEKHGDTVSYQDFSHAPVAIIREARQHADANNL